MTTKDFSNKNSNLEMTNLKSSLLIKSIWFVLITVTLTFIMISCIQPSFIFRLSLAITLLWTASITLIFLAKKGYTYLSAFIYISFLVILVFVFAWVGGGIKAHGLRLLPVVVLFSGLTLGKKEIWLFGIIASLGGFVLALADYFQLLPVTEPIGNSAWVYWLFFVSAVIILCFLENQTVETLLKALINSQTELALRKKSEELLLEKNKSLKEIAFLQSHQVRRPVANVLGLTNLLNTDNPNDPLNIEIIHKITEATKELDAVIREIVIKTSEIESVQKNIVENGLPFQKNN